VFGLCVTSVASDALEGMNEPGRFEGLLGADPDDPGAEDFLCLMAADFVIVVASTFIK